MSEYTLGYLLIAIILTTMLITGSSVFMSDVVTTYEVNSSNVQNYSSIAKMTELQGNVRDISGSLQNTSSDPDVTDSTRGIASGTWNSIWLTFSSIGLFGDMVSETYQAMPIEVGTDQSGDLWFFGGLMAIVGIIAVAAIWSSVTGKNML